MEGQKFELPEDPSQTLTERSPMGPIWYLFFPTFQNSGKRKNLAAILVNIDLINSQADLGLDAAEFRVLPTPHTSFDEINDSVVKCKRGALVRDSNPSVVYSAHTTAGDV